MEDYKLVYTNEQLRGMYDVFVGIVKKNEGQSIELPERIAITLLHQWFDSDKIKGRRLHFEGEKSSKISPSLSMAFAWIIGQVDLVHDNYLCNYLFRVSNEIYEFYNL